MIQAVPVVKTPRITWTKNGKPQSYDLTETDVLDLTRSAWREGEPVNAVIWALIQRFVATYPSNNWKTLSLYLRSYVQPINPAWFTNGSKHLKKIAKLTGPERDAEIERAKRREQYAKTPLNKIPKRYRQMVSGVLTGVIKSPNKDAQHFVASQAKASMDAATAKKKADSYGKRKSLGNALDMGVGFGPKVNWFYRGTKPVPSTVSIALVHDVRRPNQALSLITLLALGYIASQLL